MRKINVYLKENIVDSFDFPVDASFCFLVCYDGTDLFWRFEELGDFKLNPKRKFPEQSCTIVTWFFSDSIQTVPPDWELWINDKKCVSGLYMLIEIRWTKIALIHKEYRFEILFPDLETNVVPELPLPVQEMSADEWHIQKR